MKTWSEIKAARFTEAEIEAIRDEALDDLVELNLRAIREALGKTQSEMAETLSVAQSQLSRLENRSDHLVSSLRRYVEALGGQLEITAVFEGKRVRLEAV
ncbi:MAG: helix-turn-helix domain-containing protein [Acidobacteriota bacterium]